MAGVIPASDESVVTYGANVGSGALMDPLVFCQVSHVPGDYDYLVNICLLYLLN